MERKLLLLLPGAAEGAKSIIFSLNSFQKVSILSVGPVQRGRGRQKHRFFFKFLLKRIDFERRAGPARPGMPKASIFL